VNFLAGNLPGNNAAEKAVSHKKSSVVSKYSESDYKPWVLLVTILAAHSRWNYAVRRFR
jgi:hypothetical protein